MIVCGTIIISLPWIHDLVFMHEVSTLMGAPGMHSVQLSPEMSNSLQWFAAIMGTAMIVLALVRSACSSNNSQ
jgi:hypothetical protein